MNRIFEVDEMLRIGLDWAGFDVSRQSTVNLDTNVRRFQSNFGSSPLVCSALWKDLVTTDIPEARIHPKTSATLDKYLLALYFLKGYPTEEKLAAHSKMCEKVARKWAWLFACKIQALKTKKVSGCCYDATRLLLLCRVSSLLTSSFLVPPCLRLYGQSGGHE
jgi:hypothetical protein